MQAWEEKVLDRQEAYAEGKQAGEQIGEMRGTERERQEIADLCGKLMELNRMEDMKRAITDMDYRKKLLDELEL